MDAPMLAMEPAILPRLMARMLVNLVAACSTSGDVKISVRLSLILWMDSFMLSRTPMSPNPTLNPAMNRFLSSLAFSISPAYLLSISSTADVSSSPMSNSSAAYPPSAPPPEPPPPESVSGLMILSSSMPVLTLFMSLAAFLAAPPAPPAAAPALSADWAIASIPAVAADAPPPPFFPVTISVNALKALARLISLLMMRLITWMTGVRTLISP